MKLVKRFKVRYVSSNVNKPIEEVFTQRELEVLKKFERANRIKILSTTETEIWQ